MSEPIDNHITVGDRQVGLRWYLQTQAGDPWPLTSVAIRMIRIDSVPAAVKINWAAVSIAAPGIAEYAFTETDVDTAGLYAVQMRDTSASGKPMHWPVGRKHILKIEPVV